jgi:acetyl esterase
MTPSQRLWGGRNLVLSEPILIWFAEQFVPMYDREQRRHPDISPLFAELSGMPPAIFTVGTQDPLLDDTLFMEARWRTAGNATELQLWPEAPHGFMAMPMTVTDAALDAEYGFLRRTLALDND